MYALIPSTRPSNTEVCSNTSSTDVRSNTKCCRPGNTEVRPNTSSADVRPNNEYYRPSNTNVRSDTKSYRPSGTSIVELVVLT
jgi:hypothetical protein